MMPTHDNEALLEAAEHLLELPEGQRGRLSHWRVRRSVSTVYYAIFHFLVDEIGQRTIGAHGDLLVRRVVLARTIPHKGLKTALDKVRGKAVDKSVADFLKPASAAIGPVEAPAFVRSIANAFVDAQKKRLEADYDLNEALSEEDARVVAARVKNSIEAWRAATSDADRDFKHAPCVLMLPKGQLRSES
jgi:ribosomal protein S17E